MKITVLGATGFVGRVLLARLAQEGHQLTVLSRNPHAHLVRLLPPGTRVVTGDVYDPELLKANFAGADAVINLVGILNESGDNGRGFHRAHVALTKLVIAACQLAGVRRLLQMSSLNAGRGDSYYLKRRGEAEAAVKQSGLDWTIFQPSVIFGIGDGFFCRFAELLKLAPVLPLAKAGTRFAPVYVGDVVEAMRRALHSRSTVGQVYELYGAEVFTLGALVRMTAKQLGLKRLVIPLPDAAARLQALAFDFVPGKPFSSDNYRSLKLDSVGAIDGLHQLGIEPTRIGQQLATILGSPAEKQPRYDRYRGSAR
jgi:NADH dehydrogenase